MTPYEKRIMRGVKPFWAKHHYLMKSAFILQVITIPLWYPLMAMWCMRDEVIYATRDAWIEIKS